MLDAPTTATSAISAPCVSAPAPSIVHCDASNRLNPNLITFLQPAEPAAAVGKSMNSQPQSLLGEACTDSVQTCLPSNAGDPNACNASDVSTRVSRCVPSTIPALSDSVPNCVPALGGSVSSLDPALIGSVPNLSDATLSDGVDSDNSSTGAPLADPTATLRTLVDMPFMPLFGGCSFDFRCFNSSEPALQPSSAFIYKCCSLNNANRFREDAGR